MKTMSAAILSLLITVTQALASGSGGEGESLSFFAIFFIGFGVLIILFQAVPAVILAGGMLKGIFAPADKKPSEALAGTDKY
ncbi:MAG TPA: hypothetical protein VGJ93_06125 [Desulfuromonadaceae bacterium]